ncbi:hypothetical protein SAMN06269185_1201 [Natronoarchaeum philippinense]|uniref:Uncharacterized protein n=1 Tax=Natronoarchaeum philippinense TaxID=558529 RepID=A0A285NAS6_NATPI|nr:hypothetical protein [Natronoarchaeum philippinense]SNZ06529.1 hypothetical protein SAMN06269185_1201 [Natronoarchaeum philippinense]
MATDKSAAPSGNALTLGAATGPAVGALLAWLAIDVVVDPGGWPVGALVAAVAFLPLLGVALRRRAAAVAVGAAGAAAILSAIAVVRGGTPSAPLLPVIALCGAFLVGFGYALSDPDGSAAP